MNEPKTFYVCDPELHTECKKTACHLNGGPCTQTTQLRFAKQPVETVRMVFPMSVAEATELGLVGGEHDDE